MNLSEYFEIVGEGKFLENQWRAVGCSEVGRGMTKTNINVGVSGSGWSF